MYLGNLPTNVAALVAAAIKAQQNAVTVQSDPSTMAATFSPKAEKKAARRALKLENKIQRQALRTSRRKIKAAARGGNRVTVKLPPLPSNVAPVLTPRRVNVATVPRTPKPTEGGGGGGGGSGGDSGGGVIVGAPAAPVAKEGGVIPFAIGFGLLSLFL